MNKLGMCIGLLGLSSVAWAADSGQAVGGSVQAGTRATESGGRPVTVLKQANSVRGVVQTAGQMSGASAIPLSVGAAVVIVGGAVSVGASQQGSAQGGASAVTPVATIGVPLEITNETITVMPPNEALQKKPDTQLEGKTDKTTP